MNLTELLILGGRLCKEPGCSQHRKPEPCTSYGSCRLPVWSDEDDDCFTCGSPVIKLLDRCYFHEKFGSNGGNGNEQTTE
jgi:hypothetical protein